MIGQCLSNKNESATVPKTKKFSKLNKALGLYRENPKNFSNRILERIYETLNVDKKNN